MVDIVKHIAFVAVAAIALLTAAPLALAYAPLRSAETGVLTEGAPCPGFSRDGRPTYYVWEQGHAQRGGWGRHWACEREGIAAYGGDDPPSRFGMEG